MNNFSSEAKVTGLSEKVNYIDTILNTPDIEFLNIEDVFNITDSLQEVWEDSQKIQQDTNLPSFQKEGLYQLVEKSNSLLVDLEKLEEKKVYEDLFILKSLGVINKEMECFSIEFLFIEPDKISVLIQDFYDKIYELSQKNFYNKDFIEKAIASCLRKVHQLHFRMLFPIAEELSEFSYQNTFAHRLMFISKNLRRGRSFFEKLSLSQKRSVYLFLAKSKGKNDISFGRDLFYNNTNIHVSNKMRSKAIHSYLLSLQSMANMAEAFLFYDGKETFKIFQKLDSFVKQQIEQNLWRLSGRTISEIKKKIYGNDYESKHLVARSIMNYISELINYSE